VLNMNIIRWLPLSSTLSSQLQMRVVGATDKVNDCNSKENKTGEGIKPS